MTPDEIFSFNKKCAEFLKGYKVDNRQSINPKYIFPTFTFYKAELEPYYGGGSYLEHNENCNICLLSEMKFHSDWNWIMEMVEAIKENKYVSHIGWTIDLGYFVIDVDTDEESRTIEAHQNDKSLKETVVHAINQFLIWYNSNN